MQMLRDYVHDDKSRFQFCGMVNAISSLARLAEELAAEAPEGSSEEADYRMAVKILEAASAGCDLNYGDRSSDWERKRALEYFVKAAQEIEV